VTDRYLEMIRYENGMVLNAETCQIEQDYVTNLSSYLNAALIEAGTVSGLRVKKAGRRVIQVGPGLAVDHLGREIVQPEHAPPVNLPANSHCLDGELSVFIRYRLIEDKEQPFIRKAVPEIVFDGANCNENLRLAILVMVDGNIDRVVQAHVRARLTIPCEDETPVHPVPEVLAGTTVLYGVDYLVGDISRTAVFFRDDHCAAFTEPPIVEISVETEDGAVFATSFCRLNTAGFTVGISYIAGGEPSPCGRDVTVHWTARARTSHPGTED